MIKNIFKKYFVIGIIILFVGASVIPSISGNIVKMNNNIWSKPSNFFDSETIYVDNDSECPGDGTLGWPYCRIQYAIDSVNEDDVEIRVGSGTYYENIVIDKDNIQLMWNGSDIIGNDTGKPIIDGNNTDDVVNITADRVKISKFIIRNSSDNGAGIKLLSSENTHIFKNIIENNNVGIKVMKDINNNYFYLNNFYNYYQNANDEGGNHWDFNKTGNYWHDHDDYTDKNSDGICDKEYKIPGGDNVDRRPLVHPYGSIKNNDTEKISLTIQEAINYIVVTGEWQTIYVKNGLYYENLNFDNKHYYLSLEGENKETTIIDGRGNEKVFYFDNSKSVNISGFTIQNATDSGVNIREADNICVYKNNILGCKRGIYSFSGKGLNISNNTITGSGNIGIYFLEFSEGLIENNTISLFNMGIDIKSSRAKIIHNRIFENGKEFPAYHAAAITLYFLGDGFVYIIENEIYKNHGNFIFVGTIFSKGQIKHNNIYSWSGKAVVADLCWVYAPHNYWGSEQGLKLRDVRWRGFFWWICPSDHRWDFYIPPLE